MKKMMIAALALVATAATAQVKGRFEVHDMGSFRLHVYYTNDVMNDASFIVEDNDSVVTMEQPLFKDNAAEFDAYVEKMGKPVAARIADYHVGSTADHPVLMAEGMGSFTKGPVYGGMMKGYAGTFGEAMASLPTGSVAEVAFGTTRTIAGTAFHFDRGASTDFPAASITIGGKVYFTHWAPARAHASHLQIASAKAIDAEIAEARKSLQSGATLFIGGHGGASGKEAVEFKIAYLGKMKEALASSPTPEAFVEAMKAQYPGLPGEENLAGLGKALYNTK